ncbi:MAG: FKBP-type peptidyl-prolyl cis-trans isomerase [Bacteroidales bacterium]
MKKIYYFLFLFLSVVTLNSCLDDNNYEDYAAWKTENEAYFKEMTDTLDADGVKYYTQLHSLAYPTYYILYHELTPGKEDGRVPFYNSTVSTNYSGHLYNVYTNFDSGTGVTFRVDEVIPGWTLALQNMKEGAKWRVVIPWNLAYGANGNTSIPPYSTLIFDVELVKITKWETGSNTTTE